MGWYQTRRRKAKRHVFGPANPKMLKLAKKYAKKYKKTVDDVILEFIYNEELPPTHRVNSIKLWKEITMPKISEGGATEQALGPGIYLPTEKPDPSVVVPIKKTG